jgi:uncharacterized protein (TIRG00374 family)
VKNRKTEIAFFIFGLAIFIYLVSRFGVDQILSNISRSGWSLLYALLVWLVIYLLNTTAWKLLLDHEGKAISFTRLFMVTVSGFAIDTITPLVAIGGEPYKVKALADVFGSRKSLSAVLTYRMVHILGHMLTLLGGIAGALCFVPLPSSLVWVLIAVGIVVLFIVVLILSGLRYGVFHRITDILERLPFLKRLAERLRKHEEHFHEMDRVVTHVYQNKRRKFLLAVVLEVLCRAGMGIEVYLILHGTGVAISLMSALFLYVAYSIIINVVFFVPLNLGVREGGLYFGLESLALPPVLGIYLGIMIRIREFVWILLGLLMILPLTRMSRKSVPYAEKDPKEMLS